MTTFLAIIFVGLLLYVYNKAKSSNLPTPIIKPVEQQSQKSSYLVLFIKGIVGLFALIVALIFIGAIIAPEKLPKHESQTQSESYYSWASKVNKESCDKIALVGMNKGSRDRMVAIRDCNKMDFAFSFCPDCSSSEKGEVATCYEIGYDRGYYGR